MVPPSVLNKESFVVARRAERAVRELDFRKDAIRRSARVLYAEFPRVIARASGDVEVAAELNHEIVKAPLEKDVARVIHGVAFADTAEMRDHAFAAPERRSRAVVHLEIPIVDKVSPPDDFALRRNRSVAVLIIEFPQP